MANWALNTVTFKGKETKIEEIKILFEKMNEDEEQTGEGQLPYFVIEDEEHFFNIWIKKKVNESIEIDYETRGHQNVEVLVEIANHFNVDFEVTFQELEMDIFGKAIFIAGNPDAKMIVLEDEDYKKVEYLEDEDIFLYNGKEYEQFEMMEALLDEKFNNAISQKVA